MEEKKPTLEELLKTMEKMSGGDPRPMRVLSKSIRNSCTNRPEARSSSWSSRSFPGKYKHLIMIAVAAAGESETCTTTFMKAARIAGVTKEEIAEAVMVARQAKGATIFATSVDGFEEILKDSSNVLRIRVTAPFG